MTGEVWAMVGTVHTNGIESFWSWMPRPRTWPVRFSSQLLSLEAGVARVPLHALAREPQRAYPALKAERLGARRSDEGDGPLLAPPGRSLAPDEAPAVPRLCRTKTHQSELSRTPGYFRPVPRDLASSNC